MKTVAIIGGGPSALMLAAMLDEKKYQVHIYEKNAAVGRKFLVAGDGGFNLTHSENIETLITRYIPQHFLEAALHAFTNEDLCKWLSGIGIETYTGSSKRIFPVKGIKPIEVLNAFLEKLKEKNVQIHTLHEWKGLNDAGALVFLNKKNEVIVEPDVTVFALGGASWKVTGSDGGWFDLFQKKGIEVVPFKASNCAYKVTWPNAFIEKHEGKWMKNITVACGNKQKQGELVITRSGMEGGAMYALSPDIRTELNQKNTAVVTIDLKPTFSKEELTQKLSVKSKKTITEILSKEIKLTDVQIGLLKAFVSKEDFMHTALLVAHIKCLALTVTDTAPMDEAISTVGGIALPEVDGNFQLNKLPDHYVIGEMLNWDAPTGGYLLQGCFSMGARVAKRLNELV